MSMSSVGQLVPQLKPPALTNTTEPPHVPHIAVHGCTNVDYNYDVVTSLICAMYLIFGMVYTLFGYRCFKITMLLTGFTFGSVIIYLICVQEHIMPSYGNAGVSISAGLLFGLITMLIQYVGLFMMGFHTGLLVGVASLITYDHFLEDTPNSMWLCVSVLLGSGISFAVLNLYWKKGMTIVGSAIYGGAALAIALDHFASRFTTVSWAWERVTLHAPIPPPCSAASWLALAAWPTATAVGVLLQAFITGNGIYHIESISARQKRMKKAATRPRTREQRAEMRQRKYRYLYQVRTAHGDVISQSYVQALQKKASNPSVVGGVGASGGDVPGECSTLQSDATHLTILAGSDLAASAGAITESDDEFTVQRLNSVSRP